MVRNLPATQEAQVQSWEDPWKREWQQPAPVFLPGEFHGQRSLVDKTGGQCVYVNSKLIIILPPTLLSTWTLC